MDSAILTKRLDLNPWSILSVSPPWLQPMMVMIMKVGSMLQNTRIHRLSTVPPAPSVAETPSNSARGKLPSTHTGKGFLLFPWQPTAH